VIDNKVKTQLR